MSYVKSLKSVLILLLAGDVPIPAEMLQKSGVDLENQIQLIDELSTCVRSEADSHGEDDEKIVEEARKKLQQLAILARDLVLANQRGNPLQFVNECTDEIYYQQTATGET